jgi:hypothetical protein
MAAFCEFKTLFKNKFRAPEYFTFTGIWIFFILLNVSKNQLPNYIFGIMPLIALLTAKWIDIAMNRDATLLKIFKITQTGIVVLSWIAILVISLYLFPIPGFYFWVLIVAGITATVVIFLKAKRNFTKLLLPSAIALVSVVILLNMHIFPYIFSFQAPPKAARYFSENAAPGEKLYNYHYGHYELFFYSEPQAAQIHSEKEMKEVAGEEGNWIFTDVKGFNDIEKLALKTDTVIEYRHLYLNRGGRFINPKTRDEVLKPMYLIKY